MTDQRRRGPGVCRWRTGARPGVGVTLGVAEGWQCSPPPAPDTGAPGSLSRGRGTSLMVTWVRSQLRGSCESGHEELRGERRNQVECGLRQAHRWRPAHRDQLSPSTALGNIDSTLHVAHQTLTIMHCLRIMSHWQLPRCTSFVQRLVLFGSRLGLIQHRIRMCKM